MIKITAATAHIDSCEVHYLSAGKPGGRTVVLLHGMKFQAATWQDLGTLELLAQKGFHAVAVDMPGFGKSPACTLDPDTVLYRFLHMTGLAGSVLIGPSMGGRIALEFAINHPKEAAGLILAGPVGVEENRQRLPSLDMPVLIVRGSEDRLCTPENAEILHQSINGSRKIIIDGASHPCYLDKPERWHAELTEFLRYLAG